MPFQNYVCWDRNSRPKVMETVALRVEDYIFHATHFPCPINRLNPKTETRTRYSEQELFNDFLDARIDHRFCVAIGDTGTGKSHLVRWLYSRLSIEEDRNKRFKTVLIKRHSANLAAVLESILEGFDSPEVRKIKDDIQWTHNITKRGACNRVISEFAFVLDPENLRSSKLTFPDNEEYEAILQLLPEFFYDQVIRNYLLSKEDGIINRLADHLTKQREDFFEPNRSLLWEDFDLKISLQTAQRASPNVFQLTSTLDDDDELKKICIRILNMAVKVVLSNLAGLRQGNLGNALAEIRRTLKKSDKELILFIEDLSVTQGIDAELIEALLVSPGDGGKDLCNLRSIVGLTNDDFSRLQDNLKDRIDVAVHFDVKMETNGGDSQNHFSVSDLIDFASRYLNAARYSLSDLEKWLAQNGVEEDCPSFCEKKLCPFIDTCHKTFGEINGRGLYPLSTIALERLYKNQSENAAITAFNPRILVNGVLDEFLGHAEKRLDDNTFPHPDYIQWFGLGQVGGEIQAQLENKLGGPNGFRFRTALEIYSKKPFKGKLNPQIAKVFNLPDSGEFEEEIITEEEVQNVKGSPESILPKTDEFDIWLNEGKITDQGVNTWRKAIYSAIRGSHDWDASPVSHAFYKYFKQTNIRIEGQRTQQRTDLVLIIKRKPEIAVALRGLTNKFGGDNKTKTWREKVFCAEIVALWIKETEGLLDKQVRVTGQPKPIQLALKLLFLGALLHPAAPDPNSKRDVLRFLFSPWYEKRVELKGSQALKEVYKAFNGYGETVRQWLHQRLGCHKGTSIQVTFINSAELIDYLPSWQKVTLPKPLPEETIEWPKDYIPLLNLAKDIETFFKRAIEEEEENCRDLLAAFQEHLGDQTIAKTVEVVQTAFNLGNAQDLFLNSTQDIESQIDSINVEYLENQIKLLKTVVKEETLKKQVRAIAKLDREIVKQSIGILDITRDSIKVAYKIVEQKLEDEGFENPEDLYSEIPSLFEKLHSSLIQLKG